MESYLAYIAQGIFFNCWFIVILGAVMFIGRSIYEFSETETWKRFYSAWLRFSGQTRRPSTSYTSPSREHQPKKK